MIKPSEHLIAHIKAQLSKKALAKKWGITERTVYNIQKGDYDISSNLVAVILGDTGLDFEKAFVLEENK